MMQLLHSFKKAGYSVYFGTPAEKTPQSEDLDSMGIQIQSLPLNQELASESIRDLQPDIVIFDRFMTEEQFGWRVQEEAPRALRILNTEDLHSLRKSRELALESGIACDETFWLQQDITLRELSGILRSDLSLIISRSESEWLKKTGIVSSDITFYLPFISDNLKNYNTDSYRNYSERSDFCFIGYGRHAPNADAVRFLIESIWPLIRRELSEVNVHIYGKDYPADVQALHDPSAGVHLNGWVPDGDKQLAGTRVNLAPLRFGAGLKGKIVDAMEQGTPTLTTTIGAEGLYPVDEFEALIADDPAEFARKTIQLYVDESLWDQVVKDSKAHLSLELDPQEHHARLHQTIEKLLGALEAHRAAHLLGRILRHQSHQSTRYMAKWIEAKHRP